MFDHKIKQCHSFLKALFMLIFQVEESPTKEAKTNADAQKKKEEQSKTVKDKQAGSKGSQKKGRSSSSKVQGQIYQRKVKVCYKDKIQGTNEIKVKKKYHYDVEERSLCKNKINVAKRSESQNKLRQEGQIVQ